ncbi:unnamed protein product [Ceratitis capitata]|uniref:(Mediterranean fruit fly) hypothetical protein n=1 Tax=Ceratitis capitata TaxID=7213 RepID=A0A811UQ21_CERCA|nr:unnamed protein product [Ceratitis capitata]
MSQFYSDIYFPTTEVQLKLPFNEKSQSIFSKIPIGRFQILASEYDNHEAEYLYILPQHNDYLHVNGSSGEIFMTNNYENVQNRMVITLSAIPRNGSNTTIKIATMKLIVMPQSEAEYCANLENVCFWENAKYRIAEDDFAYADAKAEFKPLHVGALNSRATRYLCPTMNVKYSLLSGGKYITLKDYELYTRAPIDHELLNATGNHFPVVTIGCSLNMSDGNVVRFNKTLDIDVVDRNDNGPVLQNQRTYHFKLDSPHFRENDRIGEAILFTDKDTLNANKETVYKIINDVNELVHTDCNGYETDHTKNLRSIVSCQILFTRNGILSQPEYCFSLIASDDTVVGNVSKTATAEICLLTDQHKIHDADRPKVLELRQRPGKRRYLTNSDSDNKGFKVANILITYRKDVHVYRTATSFSRVTQPDNYQNLIDKSEVSFIIAEDRSGAFGITSTAGIVYVKDASALKGSPETVYFLNITWHDEYQRSFVINVHLVDGQAANATCDHKVKSRSQTCAQIKYTRQCTKFCGLGTSGGTCMWRGSNAGFFGSNYASCVPDVAYCPDNICDPLEELNTFICPQDCVASGKIMGPHAANSNNRGILSASGTCTCEDNGKCVCGPLDDEEPRPKRKNKNEQSQRILIS